MPDLIELPFYVCEQGHNFRTHVRGRKTIYQVVFDAVTHRAKFLYDWSCTCPSYQFERGLDMNGYCKHIRKVKAHSERCTWTGDEPLRAIDGPRCPRCHGPVIVRRQAV